MIAIEQDKINFFLNQLVSLNNEQVSSDKSWLKSKINDSNIVTCLIALISILDKNISTRSIYESLPCIKDRDISFLGMQSTMMNLGYESNKINSKIDQIDERLLPCVFTTESNSFIILGFEHNRKKIHVYDCTDKSKKILDKTELKSGFATIFRKIEVNNISQNSESNSFRKLLLRFMGQFKAIIFASFFLNILTLAMPIFVMVVYDKVIGTSQENTLYYLTIGIAIAFAIEIILRLMRTASICWAGSRIDNIASNNIFKKIIYMDTAFTENASISSQVTKIKSFESIRNFFTSSLFVTVIEIPFTIIMLIAIAMISGLLVIVPIIAVLVNIMLMTFFINKIRQASADSSKNESIKQEVFLETFTKASFFRYNGMSDAWLNKVRTTSASSSITSFKSAYCVSMLEIITSAVTSITVIMTVVVGTKLIWEENITIGALVATMIIIWRILSPIQTLCTILPRMQQMKSSIEQLDRLMKAKPESDHLLSSKSLENIEGHVQLINVGIRYNQNTFPVFSGLNIEANPGELIAISGDNGAGKTTILKLINKLYSPQIGSIRIDDMDIRQINPLDLRHYVDYLPQTPSFFEGTVKDNLRLANPMATDEELEKVLQEVEALEDVNKLEDGIETKIGGSATPICSSLAYQINIARAILKESNIILLDELPFSVLNSKSGFAYINLIKSLKGKKTIFFITHREDHMQLADKVIILKKEQSPVVMINK